METNRFLEKYRQDSQILHPVHSVLNDPVILKDVNNLRNHLARLQGAPGKNGKFFDPTNEGPYPGEKQRERGFVPCKLSRLKEQQEDLQKKWEKHVQSRLDIGDKRPTRWPEHLEEERLKLAAKILVCEEEINHLQHHLEKAKEKQAKNRGSLLSGDPMFWGSGRLKDGQLCEIAGWKVEPDKDGLLCIQDETSPYSGLPVWKFKSQIVNPMHAEYRLRKREELKAAERESRNRREVKFPQPPVLNKNGLIEYPGYHNDTIKKLKTQDE